MTTEMPVTWRNALPHLGYRLPADHLPERGHGADTGVGVNLPLELVRQSVSGVEHWPIPERVREQYARYRPTPLWRARAFERAVGARAPIHVKYEGGNISGSHKLNTALAQAHYYRLAGVRELVTGTGAGQWGTALAAACRVFGMRCTVFMVGESLRRKPYRGSLMRVLGARVHGSPSDLTEVGRHVRRGNGLSLAIGEAVEYAGRAEGRAFAIGSGETYSLLHQTVIGQEAMTQLRSEVDTVVGCVGAGSNFGGIALPFFAEQAVGARASTRLLAAESSSCPKLSRGVYAYDHTDATGTGPMEAMYTVGSSYSIPDGHSAGLRFHGAAKLISAMRHHGQIDAVAVDQRAAMEAARLFAATESTLPAPESGHALAAAARAARDGSRAGVLVCLSGHGYLDLGAYEQHLAGELADESPADEDLRAATACLPRVESDALVDAP
ncbi:tryptophan synthase beta chain [Saccharothrix coeruleofusca]|uniref:TrpB-like pyridoxal phosphate-dependent enzyme n=1 Tax=Saccharothrix coeruleofusca TaxID=33919 RepID=UPI001AE1B088|nr:TrpB-like pyridoxal phosphate-dependent enzyme [Saccharothrix coeruleofusca]MBP2336694.1 tryptophan synthase beta chain [Saccharothrix coeruleofusca]